MNWLGRALLELFPPEPEPGHIMSDDMKRYHRYLGPKNSLRYPTSLDWMEMRRPGEDTWQRVPPLAEFLAKHPR